MGKPSLPRGIVGSCVIMINPMTVHDRKAHTITKVFPCDVLKMTARIPIAAPICYLDRIKRLHGYLEAVKADNKSAAESMLRHDSCLKPSTLQQDVG